MKSYLAMENHFVKTGKIDPAGIFSDDFETYDNNGNP